MSEKESLYRTPDGKIVLVALKGVGGDSACSFAHMHGWEKNGFPREVPGDSCFVLGKVWSILAASNSKQSQMKSEVR